MSGSRRVLVGWVGLAVVLWVPLRAGAQSTTTFTLEEVQRLALGNYEAVHAAQERVEQARDIRRQAGAVVLPKVTLNSVVTRNFISSAFEFGGRRIEILPANDYNVSLAVSQPIYAGLRDLKARDQADLAIEMARTSFETTAQDTLLDATRAYYRVLGAQENLEISRRALAVTEETLRASQSLYRAGEAVETTVLRARVANSDARRELLEAENGLLLAKQQLALVAGITDEFQVSRPPRPAPVGAALDDLIRTGIETRLELQTLDLQRQVGELEVSKIHGQYLPTIRAEGTYLRRRSPFPSANLSSVSINATWTLFDGGQTAAQIAGAKSQLREVAARQELLRKQTEQQIRAAYLNVQTLSASVDMLTAQVEFAQKNAESTAKAFRVGEATDLDVLEANATLTRSERQLSMTTYTLEIAIYELQRVVGTFGRDVVAQTAGEAE